MSKELSPCPFCDCPDIEVVREGTSRVSCIMQCEECGCRLESNEIGYGDAWNTRYEPNKLPEWVREKIVHRIAFRNSFPECLNVKSISDELNWVLSLIREDKS